MRRSPSRARRGFTILEVVTAITIVAILGLAMTRLILGQTRAFQLENGGRRARSAARSAMNILITDLRMTQDYGGVVSVDATNNRKIEVRVPLVFGVVCKVTGSGAILSLVTADSLMVASAKYAGYAVRTASATDVYSYSDAGSSDTISTTGSGQCTSANMYADTATITGRAGRVVSVSPAPPAGSAVGDPAFVYQKVAYEFKDSQAYPSTASVTKYGLWRTIKGRANTDTLAEELIAPFGSTAKFGYYTNGAQAKDTATYTAPASLNSIRGFKIYLPAETPDTVPGRTSTQKTFTTTAVFFKNTRNP